MPATKRRAAKEPEPTRIRLSPKLDQKAAIALADNLRAHRGSDLVLDAKETSLFGSLAAQAVIAAARAWAEDGKRLSLTNINDGCVEQLGLLGLTPETLVEGAS